MAEVTAIRAGHWEGAGLHAFLDTATGGSKTLYLIVDGIHCPGCIRKIEGCLLALPGVTAARLNFSTKRLTVCWQSGQQDAEVILETLAAQGYDAVPYDPKRLGTASQAQQSALLRALGVAGFAAANVMLLSVSVWSGLVEDMDHTTRLLFHWLSALIALPAIAYAGRPFYRSAVAALRAQRLNMDVPIALAIVLASALSLYRTAVGEDYVYFDAALMLVFFLLIGRALDLRVRGQAHSAAQNLLALRAVAARVVTPEGEIRSLPVEALRPGMVLQVVAGEKIPADGRVLTGISALDTSLVTGESLPRETAPGALVYAGTTNISAPLTLEVTATDEDSLLSEIVRLMEAAEQRRGRFVGLADRAAKVYAPAVHGIAAVTFAGWMLLGTEGWESALMKAVAVLIITCPCALGLAVPVVQVVAIGRLMRAGVIVKAADGLERLAEIDHVVFDKTGTLTRGQPSLIAAQPIPEDRLCLAAALAAQSQHPLARALAAEGQQVRAGSRPVFTAVEEVPGYGLSGVYNGRSYRLGRGSWCGVPGSLLTAENGGAPELWFAGPDAPPQRFTFQDRLRPGAKAAIDHLRAKGLPLTILSGDRHSAVAATAASLGIADWRAELSPKEKIEALKALSDQGRKVLMVGDGLNDAPALAEAHASLSPASAADISQTSASLIFQGEDLRAVVDSLTVAKTARTLVFQNFGLAFVYNVVAVPLAVVGLVTPLIAALAMSGSSLLVTLNALRLSRFKGQGHGEAQS